jgi:hypothetical protein
VIAIVGDINSMGQARGPGTPVTPVGRAAVGAGATVEVVGVVAEGAEGDRSLVALARERLGHAALLRSAARSLEPADLGLALRYLSDLRVVVLLGVAEALLPAAVDGAAFAGATMLVVTDRDAVPVGLPGDAIVIQAPTTDAAGTFAGFVGQLAARLDSGASAADAWTEAMAALAVEPRTEWLPERA